MGKKRMFLVLLQKKTSIPSSEISVLKKKKVDKKRVFSMKNEVKKFINS
jgi:hypothetical protein